VWTKSPFRPRLGLLGKFALASLLPVVVLGLVLAHYLKGRTEERALGAATEAAVLSAGLGIQPLLSPSDLERGLSPERYRSVDRALRTGLLGAQVTRIKIWNREGLVVYSDDRALVGRRFEKGHELEEALEGEIASEISHLEEEEERTERSHGTQLEVYVPLRFEGSGRAVGAFEVYLPYRPIAARIESDTRSAYLLLGAGLALLWGTSSGSSRARRASCAASPRRTSTRPSTTASPACPTARSSATAWRRSSRSRGAGRAGSRWC
jgi:hypothetical protein